MGHKFFSATIKRRGGVGKIKEFGVLRPKLRNLAGAPTRDPNTERNANAGEKEDFPWVKEPLEEVPYQFDRRSISAMPRSSPQVLEDRCYGRAAQLVLAREDAEIGAVRICSVHSGDVVTASREHVGDVKGIPIEVESLDIVDGMLQERVARSDSHKRVIETDGETRWGYPVNSKEKVEWFQAFYVEVKVYATKLVENQVSNYVGALYLLFVTEVGIEEIWVVFGDERVRSLRVPKLELPLRTGMESGASGIGYGPFLFHSQITQPSLVYDPRNDIWRVRWWDEILEVPTVTVTENGMRKKSEGEESVQQGEQNGQPVVEDDDWDGEKGHPTVVVTLDGERR